MRTHSVVKAWCSLRTSTIQISQSTLLVAGLLYDSGDIDEMPDGTDLAYSLEYLEGVVCQIDVLGATILEAEPATKRRPSHESEGLAP
jgi:hypothetical protein